MISDELVAEFLANTDSRLIIGLIGTGFVLSWFSELIFSTIALIVEKIKNKIKGASNKNV